MATPAVAPPPPGVGRIVLGLLLAITTGVVATAGVLSWWVHDTVMDTDRFVEVVEPVATADGTVARIGEVATTRILTELDLEGRIATALAAVDDLVPDGFGGLDDLLGGSLGDLLAPGGTDEFASTLAADLEGRVTDAIDGAVQSPRFRAELVTSVRVSHADLVAMLRASDTPTGSGDDRGDLVVDLEPLVDVAAEEAVAELDGVVGQVAGQVVDGLQVPPDVSRLVLVRAEQLDPWRALVGGLDRGKWVLLAAGVLLALATVAVVRRWWGLAAVGVAVVVGAGLVGPVLARVQAGLLADVVDPMGRVTTIEVLDAVIAPVGSTVRLIALAGVVLAALGLAWGLGTWAGRADTA